MVPVEIGNTKLLLIDTPGFDDTTRTDADILNEIARVLAAQYALGFDLKGIIYVHRIMDVRYAGSNVKTFEIFKRIVGEAALSNVLLVTTRWDEVDEATGAARERQLREKFWAYMLARDSCMSRFHGDRQSALALASQLLMRDPVVLALQREMVVEGRQLHETAAGSYLDDGLEKAKRAYAKELADLEKLRAELLAGDREMRRRLEADWEAERAKLRNAEDQQVSLRRDVAGDVKGEIEEEVQTAKGKGGRTRSALRGLSRLLPLVPPALSILGLFVGIPPGSFELLSMFTMGLPDLLGFDFDLSGIFG